MWNFIQLKTDQTPVAPEDQPRRKRWSLSFVVSTVVHIVVLLVLCWPTLPVFNELFIKPNFVVHGEGGYATPVAVALYLPADTRVTSQAQMPQLTLPVAARTQKKIKSIPQKRTNLLEKEDKSKTAEAGSKHGSELDGPAFGDEVVPALVQTFPDPKIPRGQVPSGVVGDVVVEITIDVQGNVIEEKLLKGIGYGIDETVIAAVRAWHFRPATRNGVPIPSKHDVLYHFPS